MKNTTVKKNKNNVVPIRTPQSQNFIDAIKQASVVNFRKMMTAPGFQRMSQGNLSVEEYKAILREIYRYARENPQMLGCMASRMKGGQREVVQMLFRHASSEIGHDQMALQDLKALGEDIREVELGFPLPSTTAFTAYGYYQIDRLDPAGFLGFLYYLEIIPTLAGSQIMEKLKMAGLPEEAMSFIAEHAEVDQHHTKLIDRYVELCITNHDHLKSVIYGIECTASLYGEMITKAIESVHERHESEVDPLEKNERL